MSLATQQNLTQARSNRDDALRRISVGEDTTRVKQLLSQATNNISRLEKQFSDELAEAKKMKSPVKKERFTKHNNSLPSDIDLACVDCASTFSFSGKDQVFYTKNNYKQPIRCTICRDTKKNAKPEGVQIKCMGCKTDFFFSEAKAAIFEEKGWAVPKWCSSCKATKNKD